MDTVPNLEFVTVPSRHVFYFPNVLGLPALLDLIVMEFAMQVCLEKAARPPLQYSPHFLL